MAVQFQSSQRRAYWTAVAVSLLVDYAVAYGVLVIAGVWDGTPLWALMWTLAFQFVVAGYAALNFGKRIAWYFLFEREGRVAATAADILRNQLPAPEPAYNDADDYLYRAAMSEETPSNGRLYAGMILGAMAVQRMVGPRVEAMLTGMTVEAALQRVPHAEPDDELTADDEGHANDRPGY